MTFPNEKFYSMKEYSKEYFNKYAEAIASIDSDKLDKASELLTTVYQ